MRCVPKTKHSSVLLIFSFTRTQATSRSSFIATIKIINSNTEPSFGSMLTEPIFSFLDLFIRGLLPFSFCETKLVQKHFMLTGISVKTIMKYVDSLTKRVELKVAHATSSKCVIAFDKLPSMQTHFARLLATFFFKDSNSYS